MDVPLRTTIAIDDDVLTAAKALAARQRKSIGKIISALARQALKPSPSGGGTRNGISLLSVRTDAVPITPELVSQLRDELP